LSDLAELIPFPPENKIHKIFLNINT
jgi:hypothetical protein